MSASDDSSFVQALEELSRTRLADCYQCGKCTAGCPMAEHMEMAPNRVIRMLRVGATDSALRCESIWQCLSCQTCSTRCPKGVDLAAVLDVLRQFAFEHDMTSPKQQKVLAFHKAFLDNIKRNGRLNEIELIAQFKVDAFAANPQIAFMFKDATLALKLTARHKLHVFGDKVRDRAVVRRIFERCMDAQS